MDEIDKRKLKLQERQQEAEQMILQKQQEVEAKESDLKNLKSEFEQWKRKLL